MQHTPDRISTVRSTSALVLVSILISMILPYALVSLVVAAITGVVVYQKGMSGDLSTRVAGVEIGLTVGFWLIFGLWYRML